MADPSSLKLPRVLPQVLTSKCMARTGFEITLESSCFGPINKRDICYSVFTAAFAAFLLFAVTSPATNNKPVR